jgi:hypothetical protein
MNSNNYANILDIKETAILQNLKRILRMKQIDISEVVLVNYIRNNHMPGFIGVEQINKMIQECVSIENNNNKVKDNELPIQQEVIEDSIINTNDVDEKNEEAPQTIAKSIISNIQSSIPKRELREELIYLKGISGVSFTNTFILNKTYNNVESLELMNGYINDDRATVETNVWEGTGDPDNESVSGIKKSTIAGSIGPIPFLWLDIVEPTIRNYSHYVNYTQAAIAAPASCGCGLSSCHKCGVTGQSFQDCSPGGTFLVSLKQISSVAIDLPTISGVDAAANMVYIVDKGEYEKKFNQLISMNKLKLNLKNINGRMLWGCDACNSLGNESNSLHNLLRWEFIFKIKYYVNVLENNFLLQN